MAKINLFSWWMKPKKWIKLKKCADFEQAGRISIQLNDGYLKNEETTKIRKIYDNFRKNPDWKVKIIINFSDLRCFPIFVLFIFKWDTNFLGLWPKYANFFNFIYFLVLFAKKIHWFLPEVGNWWLKSKKLHQFQS